MPELDAQKKDNEEISLVDILLVLLRQRRLILVMVLIGIVTAGGIWVIFRNQQVVQPTAPVAVEGAEGRIGISISTVAPAFIREEFHIFFYDPHLYYDALREAGYRSLVLEDLNMEPLNGKKIISLVDPAEKEEALMVINRRFINNQGIQGNQYPGEDQRLVLTMRGRTMEILFRHREPGKIKLFLAALKDKLEKRLGNFYNAGIIDYVSYFETYKKNEIPGQAEYLQYRWAKAYLEGEEKILVEHIPVAAALVVRVTAPLPPPKQAPVKTVSLVILAGFVFGAVFLAFVIDTFKNIKKNEAIRTKIREALGKENRVGE
jgi:hypothetical protein